MHLHVRAVFCTVLCAFLVAAATTAPSTLKPEAALRAKGLRLVSHYYLLEDDINLAESMRAMKAAQYKVDDYTHHQAAIEGDIDSANSKLSVLQNQNASLSNQLSTTSKNAWATYNHLVDQVNAVRDQIRQGNKYVAQRQKELAALDDPSDQYVAAVTRCNDSMTALAHRYDVLAADPDVTGALAAINKTASPKVQLGPSAQFKQQQPVVQKLAKSLSDAAVPFVTAGGVPQVPVTINEKLKLDMIVDSGAAVVTLSADTARKLGLKLSSDDPVIHLHAADGKTITAHLKTLKSVRLGPFEIANVQCAIQPPAVKDADDLLGDTFLRNFIYRMDLSAGVLHLSERAGADTAPPPPEAQPVASTQIDIVSARWGSGGKWVDVTDQIKKLVAGGDAFTPSVKLFAADPNPGYRMQLQITVMQNGATKVLKFPGRKEVQPTDLQP